MLTLAEILTNSYATDAQPIVDEFGKSSYLLTNMPFDATAVVGRSGGAWKYDYYRVSTQMDAHTRPVNTDFTADDAAKVTKKEVELAIFGGLYKQDRATLNVNEPYGDQVAFQTAQKIKAMTAKFNDLFINGDSATDANAFDGLSVILADEGREYNTDSVIDLSTAAAIEANWKDFLDQYIEYTEDFDGKPSAHLTNTKGVTRLRQIGLRADLWSKADVTSLGSAWAGFLDGVPVIDMQQLPNSTDPVVKIYNATIGSDDFTGLSDIYTVRFGLDGVHAVAPADQGRTFMIYPPANDSAAIKIWSYEMIVAAVVKSTKSAKVFRNIKVQ